MKKLSKEEMKKVMGGYIEPPPQSDGGSCCNCYCSDTLVCPPGGECPFCNPAAGVRGPHGETSLCSKIRED